MPRLAEKCKYCRKDKKKCIPREGTHMCEKCYANNQTDCFLEYVPPRNPVGSLQQTLSDGSTYQETQNHSDLAPQHYASNSSSFNSMSFGNNYMRGGGTNASQEPAAYWDTRSGDRALLRPSHRQSSERRNNGVVLTMTPQDRLLREYTERPSYTASGEIYSPRAQRDQPAQLERLAPYSTPGYGNGYGDARHWYQGSRSPSDGSSENQDENQDDFEYSHQRR